MDATVNDPWAGFADTGPAPSPASASPTNDPWGGFVDQGPSAQTKKPLPSWLSALEGAADTATFGFRDELYGLSQASALPSWAGGFRAPVGAIRVGLEYLEGQPSEATRAYEQGRNKIRALSRQAQEDNPNAFLAGQVGGAVLLPGVAGAKAMTVGGRAAKAAFTGAAQGGLYGLGSGETAEDRLERGLTGAALGGAIGAVAAPIVDAAGAGIGKLVQGARSIYNTLRSEISPAAGQQIIEDEAAKRIVAAQATDLQARGPSWTPEQISAANTAGIPRTIADVGGEQTMALARSSANQSSEARAALTEVAQQRFAGQSPRAAAFIRDLTGGADAAGDLEAIQAAGRKANRGAYARAYADGGNGLWSPELERLAGDPALVTAAKEAARTGQTRAIADGFGAYNPGLTVTDDGRLIMNNSRAGVPTYPDLQFWDYTYRNLRDSAASAFKSGQNNIGDAMSRNARSLRDELDRLVPSYKDARAGAAAAFGAEDALEAGKNFVTAKGENGTYARAIGKFNPSERELFARGFASELADRVLELRDNQDVIKQAFVSSPASRQRIGMALGPDRANQLEVYLRAEGLADRLRTALGNSTTARQLAEMGLAGAGTLALGHGAMEGEWDAKHALTAALLFGAAYGKHRTQVLDNNVARRVGEMLASDDPTVLRRGIQVVANNANLMRYLRTAGDNISAMISGKAAPRFGISKLQGPANAAAEPQQNQ